MKLLVELADATHLTFDTLTLPRNPGFLLVHAVRYLLEVATLALKVAVLLLQDRLLFVEELTEVVELAILKHLEAGKSG